jgi:hypothetical protein
VTAAIGLAIVAAGPLLVGLLYGGAYASAGALLPLLVLAMIVSGTVYVLIQGLLAAGRPGIVTLTQFVGLALGVPFFLVLVPASGAQGAAIALLASATIRLALVMACYPLWLRAPLPRIWIDRNDLSDPHRSRVVSAAHEADNVASHRSCGMRPRLRIFVAHPSEMLTDHVPHGDGLVAFSYLSRLAARGHELHVAAQGVETPRARCRPRSPFTASRARAVPAPPAGVHGRGCGSSSIGCTGRRPST